MFPYGCHSGAYGAAYAIYEHEAEILKQDKEFIKRFLRGVELLMLSWGWDLYGKCEIDNPDPDQCWQDWPIRLYKCAKSLKLFGFEEEFKSVREYAIPFYNTEGRPEIHLIGIWKETALYHKKQLKTTCYDNHNLFNHSGLHNLRKRC